MFTRKVYALRVNHFLYYKNHHSPIQTNVSGCPQPINVLWFVPLGSWEKLSELLSQVQVFLPCLVCVVPVNVKIVCSMGLVDLKMGCIRC